MDKIRKKVKTSMKLLIGTVIALLILLILCLSFYRIDYNSNMSLKKNTIKEVALFPFDQIHIGENWDVEIKQNKVCKIEFPLELEADMKSRLVQKNQILSVLTNDISTSEPIKIIISVLDLKSIKIEKTSQLNMSAFNSDTISIALEEGASFLGDKNKFGNVAFSVLK